MPFVVVDTSISLPATLSPGGLARRFWIMLALGALRAALLELLPYGTPDDWVAIGSAPLFDEYERKLREIGRKLDPALREEDIPRLRRQLEVVCVAGTPPVDPDTIPLLTQDRKDDAVLYTALAGDADLLISDDKHLVPDRHEHLWEHEDQTVTAVTFQTLVTERLGAANWGLGEIDGSWLAVAHESIG